MQSDTIYFRCRIHNKKYIDIEIIDVLNNVKYYGNSRYLLLSTTYADENTIKYLTSTDFNYTSESLISRDILEKYFLLVDKQTKSGEYVYLNDLITDLSIEELFI